ncbi:helix-turn-helix domain-containing protein [Streptomyces griseus]
MAYKSQPTIGSRILGGKLSRARDENGMSAEEAATALMKHGVQLSAPTLYRHESGHTAVKPEIVEAYASIYQVDDPEEIGRWLKWAKKSKEKGPWASSGRTIGPTFRDYADAESLAEELRTWQPDAIPGLLQTKKYSEEIIRISGTVRPGEQPSEEGEIQDRIALREARKAILANESTPRVWAVIGEAAVRTPLSQDDPESHREQIQNLLMLSKTRATIQVIPMASGLHGCLSGAFDVVTFGDGDVDMVFREGYGDGSFIEDVAQVHAYRSRYERLQSQAMSITATRKFLKGLLATL